MIFIITATYPYPSGEQFLEGEIPVWARASPGQVVLLPRIAVGFPRPTPPGVEVDDTLARALASRTNLAANLVGLVFSRLFWAEMAWLVRHGRLRAAAVAAALKVGAQARLMSRALEAVRRRYGAPDVIYSYWFDQAAYAAVLLDGDHVSISRCHGFDVYEERLASGHWSYKRQLAGRFDRLYPVSKNGFAYVRRNYLSDIADTLKLGSLGVSLPHGSISVDDAAALRLVSVSYCVEIKNIDRIIDAIRLLADRMPEMRVSWRHIGGGPMLTVLQARAEAVFAGSTVEWRFVGNLDNQQVLATLESDAFDLFINASSSEGIPVSIMEAMARGIPAVAPDVGGIAEIVSDQTGVLLPAQASAEIIASAIIDGFDHLKSAETRRRAAAFIAQNFDKDRNYEGFVRNVLTLARQRRGQDGGASEAAPDRTHAA